MAREVVVGKESSEKDVEPKKKKAQTSPTPEGSEVNFEEHCFKTNELLLSGMDVLVRPDGQIEKQEEISQALKSTLSLIDDSLKTMTATTPIFNDLMTSLTELLNHDHVDQKIQFSIVKILIGLSDKNLLQLESRNYVSVVCFLLENCSPNPTNKFMVPFVKHLKKLSACVRKDGVKLACLIEKSRILKSLKVAFKWIQFCASDMGVEIIANFVAIDEECIKEFHQYVTCELISCKKTYATKFGKTYFRIWENLPQEEQLRFEEDYMQWLMERAFTLDRVELARRNHSINVQALLTGLHQSRKQAKFSGVVTRLYTPILWKYLNSHNNIHRSNATEIYMDVYPLEKPGQGMKSYSKYLRKQHDEILALLNDPCPTVRVIAIKGACSNMRYFWITFQNGTVEQIIKKLVTDLVSDGSSCDVRRAVYQGLTQLMQCTESHPLLKIILPPLGSFIHDENQGVRQAFLFMLIRIKELNCKIKYWNVVDMENVAARLADDTPKNRKLIVYLIFSSFFNEKITPDESFVRVCKFIKVNPNASRYLAMYSQNEMELEKAVHFMRLILKSLTCTVKQAMQLEADENMGPQEEEEEIVQPRKKSRSGQNVLTNIENVAETDKNDSSKSSNVNDNTRSSVRVNPELNKSLSMNEPRIAHGLLDFVSMLWLNHGKVLQKTENEELLKNLFKDLAKCLPVILRYFRGTHAFFGALNLCGMIPLGKIGEYTTIVGICKKLLRNVTSETPSNEIHCIIHAMCMWNKGVEIIELVTEWIDEAFRFEALNASLAVSKTRSTKKVKFAEMDEAKPALALRILDQVFSSPTDQSLIFSKNTVELEALFAFLERIQTLVERRLKKSSPINDLLDDEFLVNCLEMYSNFIILFDENNVQGFNFWKRFQDYLHWCSSGLLAKGCRHVKNVEMRTSNDDVILSALLRVPLKQIVNVIALGKCDDDKLIVMLKFTRTCLDSEYGLYFVEMSLHIIKQLVLFSQAHHVDSEPGGRHEDVMHIWFPIIIEKIFSLLTEKVYSKETLTGFIKDFAEVKRNIIFIILLSLKMHPGLAHASPPYKIMNSFCSSLLHILLFPITECETLNVDQDVKNLPFVGSLLATIFMSQLELASALLFVFKNIIEHFTEKDGLSLLACASLLYTFAFSEGKIPKSEVMKVVQTTYRKIQNIPVGEGCVALAMNHERTLNDRTIIDVEETTESAIKEIGQHILTKIAEKLGGSLPKNGETRFSTVARS